MRKDLGIGFVLLGLLVTVWCWPEHRNGVFAQSSAEMPRADAGRFLALSSDTGEGRQQITVIDAQSRAMSVYHIDHATGAITLKGVRNIEADLLMDEFNTESPLPREIRAMLSNQR